MVLMFIFKRNKMHLNVEIGPGKGMHTKMYNILAIRT